jgi:3-polyprenyl-4-hydroxybenzoate decarboxylase
MAYKSLRDFARALDEAGKLVCIEEFVDPVLEISEIT